MLIGPFRIASPVLQCLPGPPVVLGRAQLFSDVITILSLSSWRTRH
jgi:hypothetical protein